MGRTTCGEVARCRPVGARCLPGSEAVVAAHVCRRRGPSSQQDTAPCKGFFSKDEWPYSSLIHSAIPWACVFASLQLSCKGAKLIGRLRRSQSCSFEFLPKL